LSVEQTDINLKVVESNKELVYRKRISEDPIIEIVKRNGGFSLEIEFDKSNYKKFDEIISKYKVKYWPTPKLKEISTSALARKILNLSSWYFSHKADGEHVVVIDNDTYIRGNGEIVGSIPAKPQNVYEGELMEDGSILLFDCLIKKGRYIYKKHYDERYRNIEIQRRKPVHQFEDLVQLSKFIETIPDFKCDGFIITDGRNTYKSKFCCTTDLIYKNGYLFLENEVESSRIPNTSYEYNENAIYEFDKDLNLIKPRPDKTHANFVVALDDNQL